jgi:branched-subunit amino acid ABC-type transport system permease component
MHSLIKAGMLVLAVAAMPVAAQAGTLEGAAIGAGSGMMIAGPPGAIVGGVIIGVGEKLGEFYWGPLLGSGIESWLAYMIALVFLLFRPQGLFGEKIIERV